MFIQVVHKITDKSRWAQRSADFAKQAIPSELTLHSSVSSTDGTKAFCLWESPSVERLAPMLDKATEGAAQNLYYPIDEHAPVTHLPRTVMAAQAT